MYSEEQVRETMFRAICTKISELSELYWAAGWMTGIENDIWSAMHEAVSPTAYAEEDLHDLRVMSSLAGGWVRWSEDDDGPVHVPFPSNPVTTPAQPPASVAEAEPWPSRKLPGLPIATRVRTETFLPDHIRWEDIDRLLPDDAKEDLGKWLSGQTVLPEGCYPWDYDRWAALWEAGRRG